MSGLPRRVLVLDDERAILMVLSRVLEKEGWDVITVTTPKEADGQLDTVVPDVAIVDVYLGNDDGLAYVRRLRGRIRDLGIVVISMEDTQTLANKAVESGADYFLSKPIAPAALLLTVERLFELRSQRQRAINLEKDLEHSLQNNVFPEIVTNCDSMRAVLRLVDKVAQRDLSVLICGESGTGKELVARGIHQNSARAKGTFVELNCAALPPNLVESELFGHEKGAFTGAVASRAGKIRQASGGTLFLDEIGELPLEIQPKLLRALQEKRIVPVGGKEAIESDFRLISATNRDLLEEVRAGRFREDLFYRIAVFPIQLPPLRSRMEDMDLLLMHFLRQEGCKCPVLQPEARLLLHNHHWPGNIRDLKNFAQAITLFAEDEIIDERSVRNYFGTRLEGLDRGNAASLPPIPLPGRPITRLKDLERAEIEYALGYYKGNIPEAARALGMGRATLYKYLKREGMDGGGESNPVP
ncbi:sigma-54-dependent Fis family transcriptional regulator [Candidatus Poribacteria bacterium]|nr:sigma-54-dependent Fis family transcriptional regulator [Candidatus Poribacteria bacterium]